jgi:hypothetical protein
MSIDFANVDLARGPLLNEIVFRGEFLKWLGKRLSKPQFLFAKINSFFDYSVVK